jgi:hypothetical protein
MGTVGVSSRGQLEHHSPVKDPAALGRAVQVPGSIPDYTGLRVCPVLRPTVEGVQHRQCAVLIQLIHSSEALGAEHCGPVKVPRAVLDQCSLLAVPLLAREVVQHSQFAARV